MRKLKWHRSKKGAQAAEIRRFRYADVDEYGVHAAVTYPHLPSPIGRLVYETEVSFGITPPWVPDEYALGVRLRSEYAEDYDLTIQEQERARKELIDLAPVAPSEMESEGLLDFCNRYGTLGLPHAGPSERPVPEPVEIWGYCAQELKTFVEICHAVQRNRQEAVMTAIRIGGRDAVVVNTGDGHVTEIFEDDQPLSDINGLTLPSSEIYDGYVVAVPPESRVEESLEQELVDVYAALAWHLQQWLSFTFLARTAVYYDEESWNPPFVDIHYEPISLLGALWLETAHHVKMYPAAYICWGCGKIVPNKRKEDGEFQSTKARYCSPACNRQFGRRGGEGPRSGSPTRNPKE